MISRDDLPPTPEWFLPILERNRGTCPACQEVKFIGHGPLCIDCFHQSHELHLIRGEN